MIRNFIRFAIDRPILNHILFVLLLLMAFFAYKSIPKEIFPPAELDKISIRGGYVGASADVLDKMAVKSLEDGLKSVNDLSNVETVIQNGSFAITADIKSGADNQLVLGDVKDVISTIKRDIPADMNEPTAKILIYNFPLLLIAISGDTPKSHLLEAADALKSKLGNIKALNTIEIRGDADDEVRIRIDEEKLKAYQLPKTQFYQAVSTLSSIYPAGTIKQKGQLIYLSTVNGAKDAKTLEETLLSIGQRRIRLGDVASVSFGLSTPREISHFNGQQNISINTTKTVEGNAIALSKQIKSMLPAFRKRYPALNFDVYTDTSVWIKNRINLVTTNIMFGLILVFFALFLSVNWRIATVVAIGIPTSFFIALIAAEMLGYSMNMLTMLGALIALGMLVDEAIVVAENIYRHMEMGKPPREAAIEGSLEMFPAVLTATATTVFAFLPLLIMSGQMGMFVKVLPVMISILLVSSLFEAFYFLPLHAKEFFTVGKTIDHHEPSPFWDGFNALYGAVLNGMLRFKKSSLFLIIIGIILGTMGMMKILKFELFPPFDASQVYISGKVDVDNRLKDTEKLLSILEKAIIKSINPQDVSSVTSIAGIKFNPDQTFESGEHLFQIFVNLHERKPENFFDKYINPYLSLEYDDRDMIRTMDSHDVLKAIEKEVLPAFQNMKDKEGKKVFEEISTYVPQTGIVKNDIEIGFTGAKDEKVFDAITKLKKVLRDINGTTLVSDNAKEGPLELKFKINRYGQMLGFNESNLVSTLRGLFLEAEYGKIFDAKGLIRIRVEEPSKEHDYDISSLMLETPDGSKSVLLQDIAEFIYKKRMLKLYKEEGERIWSVVATVDKQRILPSEVMKRIRPTLEAFEKEGIKVIIKGEEKENRQVKTEMTRAAVIAIFLIFISLVWMFNSLILPLIVLSTIPLSILGALIGTYLFGLNLTLIGVMGLIGLAGVVVNDGLIMLDFIKKEKSYAKLVEKAQMRLRPIFLTSITTVLGLMTIMFFASGQSLIVQPMAIALGFGVAWATLLNLIYVPLMYAVIYRVKKEA
jgi:multidrug efflux pump subunit AcrB